MMIPVANILSSCVRERTKSIFKYIYISKWGMQVRDLSLGMKTMERQEVNKGRAGILERYGEPGQHDGRKAQACSQG